jgi:hypothetical protein
MTESNNQGHGPSSGSLFKSAFFTLLGAVIVTALFIMPAEYGVDLTGIGTKLGLTDLDAGGAAPETAAEVGQVTKLVTGSFPSAPPEADFDYYDPEVLGDPFSRSHASEFRTVTMEIALDEFEQVEVKASMKQGDAFVYSWKMIETFTRTVTGCAMRKARTRLPQAPWWRLSTAIMAGTG